MRHPWHGVFPAVTTNMTERGAIDYAAFDHNLRVQLEAAVHGIVVLGTLGENPVLSADEKSAIIERAASVIDGRVPLLATVAETTTAGACRFAEQAARAGADGLMVLPGMQYVSDERETLTHFRAVADATELPIMIYNNPVSYRVDLTPAMLAELAEHPRLIAVKESSDDVRRITELICLLGDRYALFTGVDNLALESLAAGAVGWVAGLVCAFPRETVRLYDLITAGELEEARALYRWFRPLLDLDVSNKLVQNIKLVEQLVGLGSEHVRPPRLPLIGDERAHVLAVVERACETNRWFPEPVAVTV